MDATQNGIRFTPTSTQKPRPVKRGDIQLYLDTFNQTQSMKTTGYPGRMNVSYVLAVIRLLIGQQPNPPLINDITGDSDERNPGIETVDGGKVVRSHVTRERSRELVQMAKRVFKANHNGRLFCEVCGFDFSAVYGPCEYIEAHHKIPLRDLIEGVKTKPSDLAMVCANCHRMLHYGTPWPTIDELKARTATAKKIQAAE